MDVKSRRRCDFVAWVMANQKSFFFSDWHLAKPPCPCLKFSPFRFWLIFLAYFAGTLHTNLQYLHLHLHSRNTDATSRDEVLDSKPRTLTDTDCDRQFVTGKANNNKCDQTLKHGCPESGNKTIKISKRKLSSNIRLARKIDRNHQNVNTDYPVLHYSASDSFSNAQHC